MNTPQRRYPGVMPFETAQAGQYFGRERDARDVFDLILLEKLVVLFGKSGYGKSSLLNAGIIPLLMDTGAPAGRVFTPILIKFGAYTAETGLTLIAMVKRFFYLSLSNRVETSATHTLSTSGDSLWFEFKAAQQVAPDRKYVLIFDQFEEFFTFPLEQQVQLREQLAELLYTEIPQEIRNTWGNLNNAEQEFYSQTMDIRVVFSIREDRLGWLNSLQDTLPAILHKRYELKGFTDEQALDAIRKPAMLPQHNPETGNHFECHAFGYSAPAEKMLLQELKKGGINAADGRWQEGRIEAFLLQICCEYIERRLIERAKTGHVGTLINPEDLPHFDRIYEEYYNNKIQELAQEERAVAKRIIEDELVSLNEATGVVFRLNADGRKLRAKPGVTAALLKKLTDSFLLRAEPNTTGDFNYEISHDTLVLPVLKAKESRIAEEKRLLDEQTKAEKDRELAEERKKRRNATLIAVIGLTLAIVAGLAFFSAYRAQQQAERSAAEAIEAKKEADRNAQKVYESLIDKGNQALMIAKEPKTALEFYGQALKINPGDSIAQAKIRACKQQINTSGVQNSSR